MVPRPLANRRVPILYRTGFGAVTLSPLKQSAKKLPPLTRPLAPRITTAPQRAALPSVASGAQILERAAAQEAYMARQKADRVVLAAERLTNQLLDIQGATQDAHVVFPSGRPARDTRGLHWTESITFSSNEPEQTWRSRNGAVFHGRRDAYVRSLLRGLPALRSQLNDRTDELQRSRSLSGLRDYTQTDSSPLLWLLLGVTASYLLFNATTA